MLERLMKLDLNAKGTQALSSGEENEFFTLL
jgi:hypothetical protein